MTLGAYTTALLKSALLTIKGFPLILAVLIEAIFWAILGLGIGLLILRLGEDYLAIITIGVSELIGLIVNSEKWLTGENFRATNYLLP